MFSNAKWITKRLGTDIRNSINHPLPLLRKEFLVSKAVKKAVLDIVGLGFGVYYLNGKRVTDDVLTTPFTKYDKTIMYQTYDVTKKLQEGENCIAVSLGNGLYNNENPQWNFAFASWRGVPKLIASLKIEYTDGDSDEIVTNSSWKTTNGPILFSQSRSGEVYDARLEPIGWTKAGFDDSSWSKSDISPGGGGEFKPMGDLPPISICETITPKKVNSQIYDMGENMCGWCKIRLKSEAGRKIVFEFSERLSHGGDMRGTVKEIINRGNQATGPHMDTYITRDGEQEWEPSFTYHAFRYVKVTNAPKDFEIFGRVVHNNFKDVGSFECSNDILNKIHRACYRTNKQNWHSFPNDTPHREQNGYADAVIEPDAYLYNFDTVGAFHKWMRDFKDVQRPDGMFPATVPTASYGYEYDWGINNWSNGPLYDRVIFRIPFSIYNHTGDLTVLEEMWENLEAQMRYMSSMAEDNIIGYGLWDWLPPVDYVHCPQEVHDTAIYYDNAMIMYKCACLLGKDGEKYKTLADNIKKEFRKRFINNGIVANGGQIATACALYCGLFDEDEIPAAIEKLVEYVKQKDYHFDTGIFGTIFVWTVLSEYGYADVVTKMILNPTYPSYAFWIYNGATTIHESWAMDESEFNPAYAGVGAWFYKYLAGIRVDGGKITIKPCLVSDVDWVKAEYKGVCVEWDKKCIKIKLSCEADFEFKGKKEHLTPGEWCYKI